jgi:hypothetical protein
VDVSEWYPVFTLLEDLSSPYDPVHIVDFSAEEIARVEAALAEFVLCQALIATKLERRTAS